MQLRLISHLAAVTILICGTAGSASAQTYDARVGTSSASSSHAVFYAMMGDLLNQHVPDSRWTIVNTGGIEDNHALLERGEIEMMADSSYESFDHYHGRGQYEGRANQELRTLFYRTPAPQNIIVHADAGIENVQDLDGKPFMAGSRGTTTETLTMAILDALGVEPDYYHGSLEDGVSAFQDGRIVGITKASPGLAPDATYQRLALQTDIKGLSFSEQDIKAVQEKLPSIRFIDLPADTVLPGNPPMTSLLIPLVLTTTTAMPEEVAFHVVETIDGHLGKIEQSYAGVKGVDIVQDTLKYAAIPLHAGAVRYLREQGAEVPAELVPPEAK